MEDLRVYESIDSTNKEAQRLLAEGQYLHGTAILARRQTEGRGQYGRTWKAAPDLHLALSIVLQPRQMHASELPLLSLKTSVAIVKMLEELHPGLQPKIKWPNDIYLSDQKLAGILIENSIAASKVQHAIIGIGMNVNEESFPPELPNPVSLIQATGKKMDVVHLARLIRDQVMHFVPSSFGEWKPLYDSLIYKKGIETEFEVKGNKFNAFIKGVDENGKLLLLTGEQEMKSYFSHEIKWVK